MNKRILVVDDDHDICDILEFNLRSEGFDVKSVYSAEDALAEDLRTYDLILLDVMMGGMSGFKMGQEVRARGLVMPIIFLTARDTENDMLTAFSVGGDDYISKPFSIKEVIARTKAVLRRSPSGKDASPTSESNHLLFGGMMIDLDTKELYIDGERVLLTKTEFRILSLLAGKPDRIFSREDMIDSIWSEASYITERTVDVHITRLRKKIGHYAKAITNKAGYGYRFDIGAL